MPPSESNPRAALSERAFFAVRIAENIVDAILQAIAESKMPKATEKLDNCVSKRRADASRRVGFEESEREARDLFLLFSLPAPAPHRPPTCYPDFTRNELNHIGKHKTAIDKSFLFLISLSLSLHPPLPSITSSAAWRPSPQPSPRPSPPRPPSPAPPRQPSPWSASC